MVENSDTSKENEIHGEDSPCNENSKNIIFCEAGLILKERLPEKI